MVAGLGGDPGDSSPLRESDSRIASVRGGSGETAGRRHRPGSRWRPGTWRGEIVPAARVSGALQVGPGASRAPQGAGTWTGRGAGPVVSGSRSSAGRAPPQCLIWVFKQSPLGERKLPLVGCSRRAPDRAHPAPQRARARTHTHTHTRALAAHFARVPSPRRRLSPRRAPCSVLRLPPGSGNHSPGRGCGGWGR